MFVSFLLLVFLFLFVTFFLREQAPLKGYSPAILEVCPFFVPPKAPSFKPYFIHFLGFSSFPFVIPFKIPSFLFFVHQQFFGTYFWGFVLCFFAFSFLNTRFLSFKQTFLTSPFFKPNLLYCLAEFFFCCCFSFHALCFYFLLGGVFGMFSLCLFCFCLFLVLHSDYERALFSLQF